MLLKLLLTTAGVLLGAILGMVLNWIKPPPWLRKWHLWSMVAVLLVAACVVAVWSEVHDANKEAGISSASSSVPCPNRKTDAILQLFPAEARQGQRVVVHGDGYPPDTAIAISLYGKKPNPTGKLDDLPTVRADACGKFDQPWTVPESLVAGGYTAVEISASTPAIPPNADSLCCNAAATLTIASPN
ncbi:hypothetical protein [Dactylosporangium sp. NPDC048998]|uniref:hypothetical protein n=1 Tax=Dactylosporangium sp. NPDC048998 TaxID=3363976 RepID=UPI00371AF61E